MAFRTYTVVALAASVALAGIASAMPTPDYVMAAGAGDLYEKKSSQLVLQTTKNPKIRSFANMMIKDHTKSTSDVKMAAMKSGMTPKPPMLMPDQQSMIADLTAAKGTARDQAYVEQQKAAHQKALATHSEYASTGDDVPLKAVAAKIVPVVQHHIDMLGTM